MDAREQVGKRLKRQNGNTLCVKNTEVGRSCRVGDAVCNYNLAGRTRINIHS